MALTLESLFAPIARLSIARGLRFADVAEQLRLAFFRSAIAQDGRATDSKLAVMTGLQRRDIVRLRDQAAPASPAVNPLSRLVAVWRADPRFKDRVLPRKGEGSFDALAAEIRKDIHPRTMLDQLLAAGTVRLDGEAVVLMAEGYQPLAGSEDQLDYLARNLGDHMCAAVSNVLEGPAHFEQAVHYNQLSKDAVAELDQMWRDKVGAVLQDVNARALSLQNTAPGATRFRAGAYFWRDQETKEDRP